MSEDRYLWVATLDGRNVAAKVRADARSLVQTRPFQATKFESN